MITLSAFADEIDKDLTVQMDTCQANGVRCIDVRGIDGINVSNMTVEQVRQYKKRMDGRGFSVPCIGSPLGKIRMDEDFAAHLEVMKRCCDNAHAFGTKYVRVFSFYPPQGKNIADYRAGVMERLEAMVKLAEQRDVILLHENEKAIYGAKPDGVKDIFATIRSPRLLGIFDPANYIEEGIRPYTDGWKQGLDKLTFWFHIKDKASQHDPTCVPAGQGAGQIAEIFKEVKASGFSGIMTLEPHMKAAGQFAGFTGPGLFAQAVAGLKKLLDAAGLKYA
jgi:sugar phosphate isomerase/epimerase